MQQVSGWKYGLALALGIAGITGPIFLEHFYFPVPRGKAGWDIYAVLASANIWGLVGYHWAWNLILRLDETARAAAKLNLFLIRFITLTGPAALIAKWNLTKIPKELVAYVLAWALIASYFMFFHWRVAEHKKG